MIIQMGLGLSNNAPKQDTNFEPQTQITLTPFSRDKTLFDSGAAFGRDVASVPLSGTGTAGEMWFDGTPVVKHLTNADPHTGALAAMANTFLAECPGDKVALVFQAVSGTGLRELVDDANAGRAWADDAALHAFATQDGQHVGLPAMSWFASPGALGDNYDDAFFPLFTGKSLDGTPVNFPATIPYGNGSSFTADHWFGELYDPAHTRWVPYGPHRFEIGEDMQSATVTALGAQQDNLSNKQQAREAWRSMVANPNAGTWFLPLGAEPLAYLNGVSDGSGGWTDQSHPADNDPDGAVRFAQLTAHAVLQASGLSTWDVPEFDNCVWEPSGAYVEIWSSAGAITTLRAARAEPPLGAGFPHWTQVLGWQINGAPATRAELVAGRVRLFPNAGVFTASDVISYGEGGATGMVKFPEDFYAKTYKDLPIVDVGAAGIEGISLRPLPDAALLQNTLPASAPSFMTSATGPHFTDPLALGAGVAQLQMSIDGAVTLPSSGARTLATTTGNYLKLEMLPDGALRIRVRDADGVVKVNNVKSAAGVVISGSRAAIVFAIDMVGGTAQVWVGGALVLSESFVAGSGLLPSSRKLLLLATNNGSYQVEGELFDLSVWKAITTDGTAPVAPAYKTITGPAAIANADGWKQGDDAV